MKEKNASDTHNVNYNDVSFAILACRRFTCEQH